MNNHLPLLNFLTVYNKRGATQNARCPDKPLLRKAFRASFTLSAAGYIGAADAALARDFPLCTGGSVVQPIAHCNDHPLPRRQTGPDALAHFNAGVPRVQVLQHIVVHGDDVHQRQRPPISRRFQGLRERHLPLQLTLCPEMHQNLVFNAAARVSRQTNIFVCLKGGYPFDQSNRSN